MSSSTNVLVIPAVKVSRISAKFTKARGIDSVIIMNRSDFSRKYLRRRSILYHVISFLFPENTGHGSAIDGFHADDFGNQENCTYSIWDNGSKPFQVHVRPSKKTFSVKVADDADDDSYKYRKQVVKPTAFLRMFVGKDTREGVAGNSILVQLNPTKYMFVGEKIFTFVPEDKILSYRSDMGNNGVPYPFAVGTKNTYLLMAETLVPNNMLYRSNKYGPYDQYWGDDPKTYPQNDAPLPKFEIVHDRKNW